MIIINIPFGISQTRLFWLSQLLLCSGSQKQGYATHWITRSSSKFNLVHRCSWFSELGFKSTHNNENTCWRGNTFTMAIHNVQGSQPYGFSCLMFRLCLKWDLFLSRINNTTRFRLNSFFKSSTITHRNLYSKRWIMKLYNCKFFNYFLFNRNKIVFEFFGAFFLLTLQK